MNKNVHVLVHQATLLNRDGIAALACGHGDKAHNSFKRMLETLGYIIQIPELSSGSTTSSSYIVSTDSAMQGFSPVSIPNFQSERFFIYNSTFLFQPRVGSSITSSNNKNNWNSTMEDSNNNNKEHYSHLDITLYSAAAIFNMALTYHYRATHSGSYNMFRLASCMYDQCIEIIQRLHLMGVNITDIHGFLLIVKNNQAQIYYEIQDFKRFNDTLVYVRKLSKCLARHKVGTGRDGVGTLLVLHEHTLEEIALNVLVNTTAMAASCA